MKIKKWIAAGLATIMMTGMLTGCGKNIDVAKEDGTVQSDTATQAEDGEITTLTWWVPLEGSASKFIQSNEKIGHSNRIHSSRCGAGKGGV